MKKKLTYVLLLAFAFIASITVNADSSFLTVKETNDINKDITLTINLKSIDYDNFTFRLLSSNLLESVNSSNVELNNNNEEITFDYCINCSKLDKLTLSYKLPSNVKVGDQITFYAEVINKANIEEKLSVRKVVTIIEEKKEEYNKDKNDNNKNKNKFNKNSGFTFNSSSSSKKSTFKISNISGFNKVTYKGSDNNYLSSLSVSKYSFINRKFSKDGLNYFVTVKNKVTSVKVNAKKEHSKAKVSISGNTNLKVGINKVLVTVTSESGKTRNYRIFVTREEAE